MDEVVHVVRGSRPEQPDVLVLVQIFRQSVQESRQLPLQSVQALELIRARSRATGVLDLLLTRNDVGHIARNLAARAPEIDLNTSVS